MGLHPFKGNEASIGLDYRKNERQRAAALQVEEQGRIIVTGPVELVQGGRAVIVRYPIYTGPDNAFFGIASAVIDLDKLLQSSGFSSNLDIAVSMSLLMTWHAEAAGSKIRYVPARIPDLLRTPEIIAFEADAAHQDARAQANETAFRLDYNRQPGTDMEVCMPQETLEAFAEGRGMWNGLARAVRAEQLQHMARLIRELYPSFRLFLYNEKEKFSVPYTIFGSQRAAIFVGGMYLVLNNADSIRKMQRHFDDLIRFTRVHAHESADYVGSLEVS